MTRRVLISVLLVAGLYLGYRLTLKWMVTAKLASIRNHRVPMTREDIESVCPDPPPAEDGLIALKKLIRNRNHSERSALGNGDPTCDSLEVHQDLVTGLVAVSKMTPGRERSNATQLGPLPLHALGVRVL